MSQRYEIAIVGAGVGGLAAAALMRALGHWVTVYDQAEMPVTDGPGLVLPPAVLPVLERLGIDDRARALGVPIRGVDGHDAYSGKTVLDLSYGPQPALGMQRAALVDLLYGEALARGAEFRFGQRILSADTGGHPYLRIEGGLQAGPFDYLIDAGGISSPLTTLLTRDQRFGSVWTTVPLPEGESDLGGLLRQRYDGVRRMAGVVPLGTAPGERTPRAGIFWSMEGRDVQTWAAAGADAFRAEVAAFWPDLGELIGQVPEEELVFTPIRKGGLTRPAYGRLARIGDAAHQGHPMFSPGAAMALMDADVLATCMDGREMADVSNAYVLRRFLHIRTYQGLSRVLAPLFQSRFNWQARLRDGLLGPATRLAPGLASRVLSGALVPISTNTRSARRIPVRPVSERAISEPGE